MILSLPVGLVTYACWSSIEGWHSVSSGIRAIMRFDVDVPIAAKRTYYANSFTHELSSRTINKYYDKATLPDGEAHRFMAYVEKDKPVKKRKRPENWLEEK